MAAAVMVAISLYMTYKQMEYQKSQASYNEQISNVEAESERQKTDYDIRRHRDKIRQQIAKQQLSYKKAGVRLEGTPEQALASTEYNAWLDEQAIKASSGAWASEAEAGIWKMKGEEAEQVAMASAGTTLFQYGASAKKSLLDTTSKWSRKKPTPVLYSGRT